MSRRCLIAAICAVAICAAAPPSARAEPKVLVFAAASLKTALDEVARQWHASTGTRPTVSYAATSTLARQILRGAPADIFVSANRDWMDVLERKGSIRRESRRDLLGNRLVLIGHGRNLPSMRIGDLPGRLEAGRLAMALVDSVPAGIYGRQALKSLGVWQGVARRVVQADNVRAALAFVARGEAPFGIVYATDAAASDRVSVVAAFPASSHRPIAYPAALTAGPENRKAAAFYAHLFSAAARPLFERQGFTAVE